MREPRLGDIIDDYCVKCKRIMNHAVVSILNEEPAKVRCRTCHNDHDYRHEIPPPPKVDPRKAALFNQVLAKVAPGETIDPVEAAEDLEVADPEETTDEAAVEETAEESAEEPVAEAPAPRKAKAKKR